MNRQPAPSPARVYKLGGSLLDLPDWPARLARLSLATPEMVILAGGGAAADVVREWDQRFQLGEAASHRLAMRSLTLTATLVHELSPGSRLCATPNEVSAALRAGMVPIIDPHGWFEHASTWFESSRSAATPAAASPPPPPLPSCWDVTSDTLAACVAIDLRASELVLVKSVDWPAGISWSSAAEQGLVDPWFPRLAGRVPNVRWLNLRAETPEACDICSPG